MVKGEPELILGTKGAESDSGIELADEWPIREAPMMGLQGCVSKALLETRGCDCDQTGLLLMGMEDKVEGDNPQTLSITKF